METPMLKVYHQNVQDSLGQMVPFPPRLKTGFTHLVGAYFIDTCNGEVIRLDELRFEWLLNKSITV